MKKILGLFVALAIAGTTLATPVEADASLNPVPVPQVLVDEPISELIIKYEPNVKTIQPNGEPTGADVVDVGLERGVSLGDTTRTVKLDQQLSLVEANAVAAELQADSRIKSAEPNREARASDATATSFTPTDTYYANNALWGLTGNYGINIQDAWGLTHGSDSVVVGIVDSGITNHPDLVDNIIPGGGYDFITSIDSSGDGDGRDSNPTDEGDYTETNGVVTQNSNWHGTHVAGIIGASANGTGMVGVSPNVSLLPLRVLGRSGIGSKSDIVAAINWASGQHIAADVPDNPAANKASVLNLSLGGSGACGNALQTAIYQAFLAGVVVVVAAGNDGTPIANSWPANCYYVITVGASTDHGKFACFSNYDDSTGGLSQYLNIAAPGININSTVNLGTTTPAESYGYNSLDGTSMAAPFVTGTIALMRSLKPDLTMDEIWNDVFDYAQPFANPGGGCQQYSAQDELKVCSQSNAVGVNYCGPGILNTFGILEGIATRYGLSGTNPPSASDDTSSGAYAASQVIAPLTNDSWNSHFPLLSSQLRICLQATANVDCKSTTLTTNDGNYTVDVLAGQIVFTPNANFTGTVTQPIKYLVADSISRTVTGVVTVTVAPAPAINPIVAPAPLTFAAKKKFSARNFAAQSGVSVPKKSTVTLRVVGSKKACTIKSGKLATLKAGTCTVAVKVVTKVKVGKKYKYKSATKKISLVVQ